MTPQPSIPPPPPPGDTRAPPPPAPQGSQAAPGAAVPDVHEGSELAEPQVEASLPPTAPTDPEQRLINRDLSWLEFNRRVLAQATDPRTPLLTRVKFLGIFSSNLDEFFMK